MKLLKKSNVELPKNFEEIVIKKYMSNVVKPWTKGSKLEDNNVEKALYNVIYRESKGLNIPITFKEIYAMVDKLKKKVMGMKEEKKVIEEDAVVKPEEEKKTASLRFLR